MAWAVRQELALSVDDVLSRRGSPEPRARRAAIGRGLRVAEIIGRELGWEAGRLRPGARGVSRLGGPGIRSARAGVDQRGRAVHVPRVVIRSSSARVTCPPMDDLARTIFDALTSQRVAVAIASVLAAAVAALVAWRRGWFAAARRHPGRAARSSWWPSRSAFRRTWYLASPIWIRTSLVEAAPTAARSIAPARRRRSRPPRRRLRPLTRRHPRGPRSPRRRRRPDALRPDHARRGRVPGTDEFHFGRGSASIIELEPGRYHLRLEDFSVRNGPDLYVYLSTAADDYADDRARARPARPPMAVRLRPPRGHRPGRVPSAIIWCKQFSHLFAVAFVLR